MLEQINKPQDIRKFGKKALPKLASEIRAFLIEKVGKTGGHLASNLGIVELTLALHSCFDFDKDKIVWDVGHQSYVHKILTGRQKDFDKLRQQDGLSGFPKSNESKYDFFDTGHASTSVSAALGLAKARDLSREDYDVIAVIGDGALTGGLAYEGLNNAGRSNTKLTVILNDNEMSISENVGAMSKYLNKLRTAPAYIGAKKEVNKVLRGIPLVGSPLADIIEKSKDSFKYAIIDGAFFDELGFTYIGPVDGHNISDMAEVFKQIKKLNCPVLLHVLTKKGKGYRFAEESPEKFHGIDSFDPSTGTALAQKPLQYSAVFGSSITRLARKNDKIVAVSAAMSAATGLTEFSTAFPHRFFDVGIAEGHAVTFAAGLAKSGYIPVVTVYSSFFQRAYDQILHDVCIQKLPVILAIDRAGIVGADGETHQGLFDLSFLGQMPNMTILAPKNGKELAKMLEFAVKLGAPAAIRYPRAEASVLFENTDNAIVYGKSEQLVKGNDIAIVSVGTMLDNCSKACDLLAKDCCSPSLFNARFVKPVDEDLIRSFKDYSIVYIVEDNVLIGGYGSAVLQKANELRVTSKIRLLGFPDEFVLQGSREQCFKRYGLDANSICNLIRTETGR